MTAIPLETKPDIRAVARQIVADGRESEMDWCTAVSADLVPWNEFQVFASAAVRLRGQKSAAEPCPKSTQVDVRSTEDLEFIPGN